MMPEHKYAKDFVNMMGAVYFGNRKYDDLWKNLLVMKTVF